MARKSKRKGDLVSALALSNLLGRDRGALVKWAETEGMPFESRPDANGAGEWKFWTAEVVDWIERRAAEKVRAEYARPGEDVDDEEAIRNPKNEAEAKRAQAISDARKSYWASVTAAIATAKERGTLVSREIALAVFDAKIVGLKGELYNLAPQVAGDFDDPDEKVRVTAALDGRLRALLEKLSVAAKDIPDAD
jgi:phage terminase Nu1 subunit (DNA packaging protein)